MNGQKIIVVMGATGAQGSGLVRAIQGDPSGQFRARAVTRDAKSDRARALADLGAEIVEADLDEPSTLTRAFRGAYGAYCVTFYWDHCSPERELAHARILASTARTERLQHVVWSTLEDTRQSVPLDDDRMPTLMHKYKVPHFDAKGEANRYFYLSVPTTFMLTSFYWENFINFGMTPKPDERGRLAMTLPMGAKKLPGIAAADIGKCAYGIFKRGDPMIGRLVGIAGEHLTGEKMAATLSDVLGDHIAHQAVSPHFFRQSGLPGAEDLGNMFQFKRDFNEDYCLARDVRFSRSLNPELLGFQTWAEQNKAALCKAVGPVAVAA